MRIAGWLFCVYGLWFSTAHAATQIDLGVSTCSGAQSLDTGNGLSFSCSGDFSLNGGTLSSDTAITLSSLGNLTLDAFTLSAPSITLNAASIFVKSTASLIGRNLNISANTLIFDGQVILLDSPSSTTSTIVPPENIKLNPGGTISLGSGSTSLVPLPASFTLLLSGLLTLFSLSGRSATRKRR